MSSVFDKFAQEIKFQKNDFFAKTKILKASLDEKENIFNLEFHNDYIFPFAEMLKFITCINKNFKYKTNFLFTIVAPTYDLANLSLYIEWVLKHLLRKPNLEHIFKIAQKEMTPEGHLTLFVPAIAISDEFKKIASDLKRIIRKFGFNEFSFATSIEANGTNILDLELKNNQLQAQKAFANMAPVSDSSDVKTFKTSYGGYEKITIDQLNKAQVNMVEIEGMIFKKEFFVSKKGTTVFTFGLTNYKDAIDIKVFANKEKQVNHFNAFEINEWVNVKGNLQLDSYSKNQVIISSYFKNIASPFPAREDQAEQKRIELAFKTRMSTMDGIGTPTEYVKRAKKWDHQALAIIDTESVQSFPEFYLAAKKADIKAIYGVTLNVLDRNHQAIQNYQEQILSEDEYVVFDIETTGLSPEYHDIIEFGALRIKNNQILERKQFFIKPTHKIPETITQITNITNADVENAISQKEAIKIIADFIGSKALVAHNANFDFNFLNAKLAKYGFSLLKNPLIDTLIVARITLPDAKRFNLQAVAKAYSVNYDVLVAHRADYDADVLSKIWMKMIEDLKKLQIFKQKELFNYQSEKVYQKAFSHEVTIIAKNQKGLKKLFSLVSIASTKNLFKGATLFWDQLKDSNLLIGSGSLKSSLVDKMLYSSRAKLKSEIGKYDYIEVQPLQNFLHKLQDFEQEKIEDSLKWVINEAKKQGKIVVATGDVHYLDENDKILHEVYINAKGLGGKPHYLKKFNTLHPLYPNQHFLTTNEMKKQFNFLNDIDLINEIVITNPHKISEMIDSNIEVIKNKLYTPVFKDADLKLAKLVYENAHKKYGNPLPEIVEKRLSKELEPIKKYGFSVIYWISHLLVAKSLEDGYLVGSRGSVGSSLVATMAQITEVNPLDPHYLCPKCQYSEFITNTNLNSGYDLPLKKCPQCQSKLLTDGQNIPFETFLGFNADKVPDIDLNFSGDYQPIIHQEVKNIFGESHSFRAGTISTVAEKTAFGFVRNWAEETHKNLSKGFVEYLAKKVAGTKRTTGQHPGGIIVVPQNMDIEDFSPINYPANDKASPWKTTHFDFHAIHDNVLKLDLLGHDDPTAIRYLEKLTGINVKTDIPFNDPQIIKLFSSTEPLKISPEDIDGEITGVMGVPEFGTTFVRRMLQLAKVESFGDLIAVSGLSHGTDVWTGNADMIIKKQNKTLSDVISCRDNIMTDLMAKGIEPLLSFQIMESVRKGKGLEANWEKKLQEHQVADWYIESLKKIKYMFPKAHATAYVMMAWRIAYFKLYYPEAYYATYFTTRADVFDIGTIILGKQAVLTKLRDFKKRKNVRGENALSNKDIALIPIFEMALEAFARKIKIGNISLDKSLASEWIIDQKTKELIPPLISLDGLGEAAAISVVKARQEKSFQSIEDLQKRTALNKTVIEMLRKIKVLDNLSETNQLQFDLFSL